MSNVTVQEIFDLTAAAFGISIAEMAKHHRGDRKGKTPLALIARGAATLIASRHTLASYPEIGRTIGWNNRMAGSRFKDAAQRVEAEAKTDRTLAATIEAIEVRIDAVHETRAEAVEALARAGLGGLIFLVPGATPVKPPRPSSQKLPPAREGTPIRAMAA